MNDIKIGQLYQHTPTGIVRRVVYVGKNYVTLERGDYYDNYDYSRFGNIENFKKFWRPYEAPNDEVSHSPYYTNKQYMIDIKNIKGKLYRNTLSDDIERVIYADDDRVIVEKESSSKYSSWDIDTFLEYWIPYREDNKTSDDKVNHPSHYTWLKDLCGIEVIDITRHMDFNLGNSIKYILRSGHKKEEGYTDKQKTIEDLKKAVWYLNDEIKMLQKEN